jgi:CDP-L-myo-inositol myo-inositolphosphotransferase
MLEECKPSEAYRKLVKPSDGPISRLFNRHVSVRITCFIINHNLKVTPNQLTVLIGLFGFLAGTIAYRSPLLGGLLVELASILDGVDGEYARLTGKTTRYGAFLDSVTDRLVDAVIIIGSSTHLFNILDPFLALIITSWILSMSLIVSYLHCRGEASLGVDLRIIGGKVYASRDVRLFLIAIALILEPFNTVLYTLLFGLVGVLSTIYVFDRIIRAYIQYGGEGWTQ